MVEQSLGHDPSQFLYVGDHLFGDVHVTKDTLRWRTALIARELEAEVDAADHFRDDSRALGEMMKEKIRREREHSRLRMERRRKVVAGEPHADLDAAAETAADAVGEIDERIAPLARAATELGNVAWGPLMRAGVDKSLFARQVEKYADVYTSRVSNFRAETPYGYLRAARGSLPHDSATP